MRKAVIAATVAIATMTSVVSAADLTIGLDGSMNFGTYEETTTPNSNSPATEHHGNDGVTHNGNGTSTVVLGNVTFNTNQRDFSGEAVVTDPKTVVANKEDEYAIAVEVGFGINGNYIVTSADTKLKLYDMTSKSVVDEQTASFTVSGLSVNGCIMTTEGSEDVNFYNISGGKIDKHFFHIPSVNSSKFLAVCYLDYKDAYVYDESSILSFPLDNATIDPKPKAMDIPSFATVNITSDKENLYLALGDLSKPNPNDPNAAYISYSALRVFDKTTKTFTDINSLDDINYSGITVDANYIYIAIKDANIIKVINKHTNSDAGSISVDGVTKIIKEGNYLYAYNSANQKIIKYEVSFN